jgi:hypothetical protein
VKVFSHRISVLQGRIRKVATTGTVRAPGPVAEPDAAR